MIIFGYEIRKYKSKQEEINECRKSYNNFKHCTIYEWRFIGSYTRNIPWHIVGRSGRWLLIGFLSTYAKGCIKVPNYKVLDEVCDHKSYFCFRFISARKLNSVYHLYEFTNKH